jgi:type III secretion protein J
MVTSLRIASLLLLLGGCSGEELLHGLDERQANEVLVALDEGGLTAGKKREEGPGGAWLVEVASGDAGQARRILAERELPRTRTPGFGEVFGGGGMVPTPVEEHARYLHALSGELSRTIESLDGVVEARVHLGLPQDDPLRPGEPRTPRAAVLLRCRPAACGSVRALEPGIRSLVAGAAEGLSSETVSILVAEATAAPGGRAQGARPGAAWRVAASAGLAVAAAILAGAALRRPLATLLRRRSAA